MSSETSDDGMTDVGWGLVPRNHSRSLALCALDSLQADLGICYHYVSTEDQFFVKELQEALVLCGGRIASASTSSFWNTGTLKEEVRKIKLFVEKLKVTNEGLVRWNHGHASLKAAFLNKARATCRLLDRELVALRGEYPGWENVGEYVHELTHLLWELQIQ